MAWTLVEQIIIGTQWVFTETVTGSFFRIKYLQLAQAPQLLIAQAEQLEDGTYQIWNPLVKLLAQGQAETLRLDKPEAFTERVLGFRKQNTASSSMTVEVYVSDVVPSVSGGADYSQQLTAIESELDLIGDSIESLPTSIDYTQRFVDIDQHLTAISAGIATIPAPVDYSQQFSQVRADIAALSTQIAGISSGSSGTTTPPATVDTNFSNVVLLMHLEGDLTDVKNHSVTASGSASVSTTQKKFGNSSLYLPGNGSSYLYLPDSQDWSFGADDFTVEAYVYPLGFTSYNYIFAHAGMSNRSWGMCINSSNQLCFYYTPNGSSSGDTALNWDYSFTANTWYHVAVSRNGSSLRGFVNGSLLGVKSASFNLFNSTENFYIGTFGNYELNTHSFNGFMDELRITGKVGRYETDFTPPTAPFPNS